MNKLEELFKAAEDAAFTRHALREALKTATGTEALILIPLITKASELERDIRALHGAVVTP